MRWKCGLALFAVFIIEKHSARVSGQHTDVAEDEGNAIIQPSFKEGFPPYNYTPTEAPASPQDLSNVDYDLDAAQGPANTAAHASVPEQSSVKSTLKNHSGVFISKTYRKPKHHGGLLTIRQIRRRVNKELFKIYKYIPIVQSFGWLGVMVSVLTAMFKIHENYLNYCN